VNSLRKSFRFALALLGVCSLWPHLDAQELIVEDRSFQTFHSLFEATLGIDANTTSEKARREILSWGPETVPNLIRIFRETSDDRERVAVISILMQAENGPQETLKFVENEISADPSSWYGQTWVPVSIVTLEPLFSTDALRLARRILSVSVENSLATRYALSVFEKHGTAPDLTFLNEIRTRRESNSVLNSQGVDGVLVLLGKVIGEIETRASADPLPQASSNESNFASGTGRTPTESTPTDSQDGSSAAVTAKSEGTPFGLLMAIGIAIFGSALLIVFVRKRGGR